ncbi:hypothetical protein caldi_28200 [Caldinitratiruptor microaerophilus]|uniref:Uncharacterized protein n=1 Tax=Caldinitratiruptor microaerophilus TaxID=671077 RepID=A0AA35G937_9FIRM|nr:hypothetical protein caldi_28200 [Caldinitratiruptor microaerophilus]
MLLDQPIHNVRVNKRAVSCDPHNVLGIGTPGRLHVPIENVLFAPANARDSVIQCESGNRLVRRSP